MCFVLLVFVCVFRSAGVCLCVWFCWCLFVCFGEPWSQGWLHLQAHLMCGRLISTELDRSNPQTRRERAQTRVAIKSVAGLTPNVQFLECTDGAAALRLFSGSACHVYGHESVDSVGSVILLREPVGSVCLGRDVSKPAGPIFELGVLWGLLKQANPCMRLPFTASDPG